MIEVIGWGCERRLTMKAVLSSLLLVLRSYFRTRVGMQIEILALRQTPNLEAL
jgi:hypothetical protein